MPYKVLMADRAGTVFAGRRGVSTWRHCYTPFGALRPAGVCSQSAFTGQRREPTAWLYLLGGGYRGYQATLGRFAQPDRHSPFGEGGRNTYAYCAGDPMNRVDTTGRAFTPLVLGGLASGFATTALQLASLGSKSVKSTPRPMLWGTRLALLAGVTSVVSAVIAGVQQGDRPAQDSLAWVSVGLGVASSLLRASVYAPMARKAGWRKVLGRVSGLRRENYYPGSYHVGVEEGSYALR